MDWLPQYQFFIFFGFVAVLAGFFWWQVYDIKKRLKKFFGGSEKTSENFQSDVLRRLLKTETALDSIHPRLAAIEGVSSHALHKVAFLRFNPFDDTGGDNSFVVAFLDQENNGLVISSLYMREGMRVYAKEIREGKSKQKLSQEEEHVLEEAIHK